MKQLFFYQNRDSSLSEYYRDGKFYFLYRDGSKEWTLPLYEIERPQKPSSEYYLGYTKEELLSSGKDLLAKELLKDGDPDYGRVKAALPPITQNAYTILGGISSVAGLTVDADGVVYHQPSGRNRTHSAVFTPSEYDRELGMIKPYQALVGGEYPLLLSVHTDGQKTLELLYFVEPTDPDRDPICWIRIKRYQTAAPEAAVLEYRVASIAREAEETETFSSPPTEAVFLDALHDTVALWVQFSRDGAVFALPTEELSRVARATLSFAALTYTCEHAHYGHRFYGRELHDNFPPNYIFMLQNLVSVGRHTEARAILSHFFKHVLRLDGRINYRQGLGLNFGASAAEYGMLLYLMGKYREVLGVDFLTHAEKKKLIGMGEVLMEHLRACDEVDGLRMIKMCAEADTNERIHVYLNNNLWAIRGLEALSAILKDEGERYRAAATELRTSVDAALKKYTVRDTRFGDLPPFRLGYTATPTTLTRGCRDTFSPLSDIDYEAYCNTAWERSDRSDAEDLVENTYANYRYYPEMLSAMLLSNGLSDALVRMRESIGGELLCMTRFWEQLDDWPVLNYARFLLETGRIEKYLLLLYAHTAHHGDPERMTYYEQVSIDGRVIANDCIPSLLTAPTMLAWAFAYEPMDGGTLRLLAALPREWYRLPFSARRIGYSGGLLDIFSDGRTVTVTFDRAPSIPVELAWREKETLSFKDIETGAEFVEDIRENMLCLKHGIQKIEIALY